MPNWPVMHLDPASHAPLYAQLAEQIRGFCARLAPDAQLPSEAELMAWAGVGRATVRKAVAELVADGLLVSRRGKGTFVARPRVTTHLGQATGLTESMRGTGHELVTSVLSVVTAASTPTVSDRLGLGAGEPVHRIERLRMIHGEPCMLERAYVAAAIAPDLPKADLTRGLYDLLRELTGDQAVAGTESLTAVNADRVVAQCLHIPLASAVISSVRTTVDAQGRPLETSQRWARGDVWTFVVDLSGAAGMATDLAAEHTWAGHE